MIKSKVRSLVEKCVAFIQQNRKILLCLILAWLMFYAFEPLVTSLFEKCADWLEDIEHVSELWLGVLICSMSVLFSVIIVYRRRKYDYRAYGYEVVVLLFVACLYAYYRLWDDSFEFWPSGYILSYLDFLLIPFIIFALCPLSNKKEEKGTIENRLVLDDPIMDKSEDLFSHYNFAISMLDDLGTLDLSEKTYSVGVSAPWGQGKSSFLAMLTKEAKERKYIVVDYNPRHAVSLNSIQDEFFERFTEVLSKYHPSMKKAIRKYTLELGLAESDNFIIRLVNWILSKFSTTSIDDVNAIINHINRKLIVVMEDLDRLTAPEILEVLKLIDRNGRFVNTMFVTAYDKEYVNAVLISYLGCGKNLQPFTDKYFNYEFSLPQQSAEVLRIHLVKNINYLLQPDSNNDNNSKLSSDLLATVKNYAVYISSALNSMRHVKRFANIFCSRYRVVQDDVNFRDFLLLTLLRYKDYSVYNLLVTDSILKRGGGELLSYGSTKQLYLAKEYSKHLDEKWEYTCEILESLFSTEYEATEETEDAAVYGLIRYANSFHLYFYDYKVGDIKLSEVSKLYHAGDFKEISTTLDGYLESSREPFCDFLVSEMAEFYETASAYEMYAKILIYVNDRNDINQKWNLDRVISVKNRDAVIRRKLYDDNEAYKEAVKRVIKEMMDYRPWQLGYTIISLIESMSKGGNVENESIFSRAELVEIALQCQKTYYDSYGKDEWNYTIAVNLANIPTSVNSSKYEKKATFELHNLLTQHADEAVKAMTHHFERKSLDGEIDAITLKLLDDYHPQFYYPTNGKDFSDFTKEIKDADIAFVVDKMYEALTRNKLVSVECPNEKIEQGDFKKYRELIEASETKRDKDIVANACNKNFICDYSQLAELSKLPIARVKEIVKPLITEGRIKERHGKLRDKMDEYEVGDYVKVKDTGQGKSTNKMFGPNELFKIESISNGKATIEYHKQSFDLKDLLPVPIDGNADKKLYWDPVVAASVVGNNPTPVSRRNYDYYMDELKRHTDTKDASLYDMIKKAGCQYVHEAQHVLKENGYDANALKIHR